MTVGRRRHSCSALAHHVVARASVASLTLKASNRRTRLKEGDGNMSCFHACASPHCHTKKIRALVHEDRTRCDELSKIKGMTEKLYGNLFTSKPCNSSIVLDAIQSKVMHDMHYALLKP
jgi:hypothetical protein